MDDWFSIGLALGSGAGNAIASRVEDRNKRRKATKDAQMVEVLQNPTSTEKSMGYDEYLRGEGGLYRLNSKNEPVQKYNEALIGADRGLLQGLISGQYDNYGQVGGTRMTPSALESLKQTQQSSDGTRLPQKEKQTGLFASLQPDSGYTLQYSPPQPVAENKGLIASVFPKDKPEITSNEKYKGPLSMALEYQQKPTVDTSNLTDEQKTLIGMFQSGQISKEHASKFLDFDNAAKQRYESSVPDVTSYLSEAQMLKKALENGYSLSEAKDMVALARMDIDKQKGSQLIQNYTALAGSGNYAAAMPVLMELIDYNPKAASALLSQSVGMGDLYNTTVSRKNAEIENGYREKNAEQQHIWNVSDKNTAYEREKEMTGIENVYRQQNMILDTNLGLSAYLQRLQKELELKEQYGFFNPKPPAYLGDLNEAKGKLERALREAGGDPSMDNSTVKEAIDVFNDLYNKNKHLMDERGLALWRYTPLMARIDQAQEAKNENLAQKLIAQLPANMQEIYYNVEHPTIGSKR